MKEIRCTDGRVLYVAEPVPLPCPHECIDLPAATDTRERFICSDCGEVLSAGWVEMRLREEGGNDGR